MTINFNFESDFRIKNKAEYSDWISRVVQSEGYSLGEVSFVFCDDKYLLKMNQEYLGHDTLTDIITFDYSIGNRISGDIFISAERVTENAQKFKVEEKNEMLRVMAHGLLHLMGYNDKATEEITTMRLKEEEKIMLFHVEH